VEEIIDFLDLQPVRKATPPALLPYACASASNFAARHGAEPAG